MEPEWRRRYSDQAVSIWGHIPPPPTPRNILALTGLNRDLSVTVAARRCISIFSIKGVT
jgi:hypothetical protein